MTSGAERGDDGAGVLFDLFRRLARLVEGAADPDSGADLHEVGDIFRIHAPHGEDRSLDDGFLVLDVARPEAGGEEFQKIRSGLQGGKALGRRRGKSCDADKVFSVQYHPESAPGPKDSTHLFTRFTELMSK